MSSSDMPEQLKQWHHYRVAHCILLSPASDSVLLVGNRWPGRAGLVWTLPGGRAEQGEPLHSTVQREFGEETGMQVTPLQLAYVAEARSEVEGKLYLTCSYLVAAEAGAQLPANWHDPAGVVAAARFVPLSALATVITSPSLGLPLCYFLAHREQPARYWFFPDYNADTEHTLV